MLRDILEVHPTKMHSHRTISNETHTPKSNSKQTNNIPYMGLEHQRASPLSLSLHYIPATSKMKEKTQTLLKQKNQPSPTFSLRDCYGNQLEG